MQLALLRCRPRAAAFAVAAAAVAGLAVAFSAAVPAGAAVSDGVVRGGPHDPFGRIRYITAVPGGVRLVGFAIDPDALTSNVSLSPLVDGQQLATAGATSVARPAVTSYYHAGPTPAYDLTIPVPAGAHTLCLAAQNIGLGIWTVIGCVATPVGTVLTAAQLARHSPIGALTAISLTRQTTGGIFHLAGWAADPDFTDRRMNVVFDIDGRSAATVTSSTTPSPRPAGSGPFAGWSANLSVGTGAHLVCTWAVNAGFGSNRMLGCYAFDTRVNPAPLPVPNPPVNAQVLAEALTHRGQRYVWGAAGPSTFDCSGLVVYSYGKFHLALPRTSQQQFTAARLIPASRAVPGDLVFTHDAAGSVYHVGIYVAPGKAFAAIDEAEGVNYQSIWDPASTTYGSFTHT